MRFFGACHDAPQDYTNGLTNEVLRDAPHETLQGLSVPLAINGLMIASDVGLVLPADSANACPPTGR